MLTSQLLIGFLSLPARTDPLHVLLCVSVLSGQPARLIWSINGLVRDGASWVCVATVGCWSNLKAHLCVFARQRADLNSFKFVFCSHL